LLLISQGGEREAGAGPAEEEGSGGQAGTEDEQNVRLEEVNLFLSLREISFSNCLAVILILAASRSNSLPHIRSDNRCAATLFLSMFFIRSGN
jgi:hypothetical protein